MNSRTVKGNVCYWILLFFLTGILAGCARKDATVPEESVVDVFVESSGQAEELMQEFPEYSAAKSHLTGGEWDKAAAVLEKLLQGKEPPAPFANDLGVVEMRRGQLEQAKVAFQQAVEIDPEYERAWFNLGVLNIRLGTTEEAEAAYEKALQINPYYYEARYNLGLLFYQQGRLQEAEFAFRYIAGKTRSDRFNRVYYQLGLIFADQGNDSAAVGFYDESLLLDPSHLPSYLNKAAALIRLKLPEKARETLEKARRLNPDDSRVYWNLGLTYLDENDDLSAEGAFKRTLSLDPQYAPAFINLATISMRAGNLEEAKGLLEKARLLEPENPSIPWNLGLIAVDEGADLEAIGHFTDSVELDPRNAEAHLNISAALIRLGQLEKAREAINRAAALSPEDYRIFWNRGLIALQEDQDATAREDFQRVVELQPDYAPALFNLGLSEYRAGNLGAAKDYFHRAAYADPENPYPEAHYMLAKAYSDQGNPNAAINEYEVAVKLKPDYFEAAYNLALNLDEAGDHKEAVRLYKRLADGPGAPPEALNNLAAHWLGENQPGKAVPFLERALELDPAYSTAAYNLGLARLRMEDFPEAIVTFTMTVELEPDKFPAWKNLGIAHARMDDPEAALEAMQEAFDLNPADADTAVYVVKYLKLLDQPEERVTEVYRRAYATGARNPLMLRHLAEAAFGAENYGMACEYYEEYIKLRPAPAYIYNLGLARLRNEQFERAAISFAKATELDPTNFAYWKNLGITHSRMEDFESALTAMRRAFELNPSDPETAVYTVKYLKLLDRPEIEITEIYQRAYLSGSRNTLILSHLAQVAFDGEAFEKAAKYYGEYLDLRPSAVYYYNLGLALLQAEDLDEAIEAFIKATELDPSNFAFWKNLGIAHSRNGDFDKALQAMARAFDIDPADPETAIYVVKYLKLLDRPERKVTEVYQRAYAAGSRDTLILRHLARDAFDRDDFDLAARHYTEYLELRPSPVYYYNLGLALRKGERFAESRQAYRKAVEMDPLYEKAWLNLGYVHAFLGDETEAESAFKRALEINPNYTNAADALQELKSGKIRP